MTGVLEEKHDLKQVVWTIEDFFSLSTEVGVVYESDTFSFAGEEWSVRIFPGGETENAKGWISLFIGKELTSTKCSIFCTLDLKKADGSVLKNYKVFCHVFEKSAFGYAKFCRRSELLESKSELIPPNILTVICTLRRGSLDVVPFAETCRKFTGLETLSKNFEELLAHKKSCDVTLVVRGKSFRVHKSVLIARSPVFSAMFEHDMSENQTGTVDIPDCDEESFQTFLEYLYSGTAADISFNSALQLYRTAHKYEVQELKSFCLQLLKNSLTVEDVLDAVILADQYGEDDLMFSVQDFFNRNFDGILSTKQWEALNKQNFPLANKLNKGVSSYLLALKQHFMNEAAA